VAFKIRQNPFFGRGSCPGPRWGAHDAPHALSRLGHPFPYLTPLGTDTLSALAMPLPPGIPADLHLWL